MNKSLHRVHNSFIKSLSIFFLAALGVFSSADVLSQVVVLNRNHITLDQRTISVFYNGVLSGSVTPAQFQIRINGVTVLAATGVSASATGPFGATASPTTNGIHIQFNASTAPGHTAATPYLLPNETLQISFTNTGNTLTTLASGCAGCPVASYGFSNSVNNYSPVSPFTNDITFSGENIASVDGGLLDQCAPVNTNFYAWTYVYALRYRNSTAWITANNRLRVQWGNGADQTDLPGYLSNGGGDNSPNQAPIAAGPGGGPGVFLSFRSGLNPTLAAAGQPYTVFMDNASAYSYSYPDNLGKCNFRTTHFPFGVTSATYTASGSATLQKNTQFNSYDYDDQNTGSLVLNPTVTNSELVCLGTNVNMTFTDASIFNCIGNGTVLPVPGQGAATTPINNQQRWIRFIYGGFDSPSAAGNIRDIRVGGVQVTDPVTGLLVAPWNTGGGILPGAYTDMTPNGSPMSKGYVAANVGGADANGVITLGATATVSGTLSRAITTLSTANHAVDQRFYVTIQYWGVCNPYPTSAPVEMTVSTNYVRIIDRPNPPTAPAGPYCENDANSSFNITATGAGAGTLTYTWYKDAALTQVLQAISTDNTFNPVTEGPTADRINKTVTGSQTFHRYVTVTQGSNQCTSLPTDIVIRIDDTNTPGVIAHPLSATTPITVCSGTDPVAFTSPTAATGGGPGGTVTYQWQSATNSAFTAGLTNVGTNSATFDPPAVTSHIYYRRRASSGQCADVFTNVIEFLVDTPVNGGQIGSNQIICSDPENGNPALLTNTTSPTGGDNSGTSYTYQWESSTTAISGPFNTIGGATASTYDPPAGLATTTYYRRRVTSGICSGDANSDGLADNIAYSNVVTVTVQPVIVPGSIGSDQSICANGDPALLTSSAPASGGNGALTYQWQSSTTSATTGFTNIGSATAITYDPPAGLTTTTWYRRTASGGACNAQNTVAVQVTVYPLPTAAHPTTVGSVCAGNPAPNIVWTLTGRPPFNIHYTVTKNGGTVFPVNILNYTPTETVAPYTFTIVDPNPPTDFAQPSVVGDSYVYQMVGLEDDVTSAAPTCSATALGSTGTVTIGGTPPAFDTAPSLAPTETCVNGSSTTDPQLNFSLDAASTTSGTYTLTYKINGGSNQTKTFTVVTAVGPTQGDPSSPITFSEAALNVAGTHTITLVSIQSPTNCLLVSNTPLTFIVRPLPVIGTQPTAQATCTGGNVTFSVAATGTGLTYQWQEKVGAGAFTNLSNTGVYSGATSSALTITGATNGMSSNQYRVIVTSVFPPVSFSCPVTSNAVALTVNPYATITTQPINKQQCIGLNTTFDVVATGPGLTYQWQVSTGGPFTNLSNTAPYSGVTTATLTITNITAGLDNNQYRVVLTTTGSCPLNSNAGILTAYPLPTAIDPLPKLCEDVAGGGTHAGVVLSSYNDIVTGIIGSTGRTVTYYSNSGRTVVVSTPQTVSSTSVFYTRVENTTTSCKSDGTVTFTVNALPAAIDKTFEVCEDAVNAGVATNINLTSYEMGAGGVTSGGTALTRDVEWYEDDGSGGLGALIPGGSAPGNDQKYFITSATNVSRLLHAKVIDLTSTITPKCFDIADVTLKYKIKPKINPITGPGTVCTSSNTLIYQIDDTFNGYGIDHRYTWTVTGTADFTVTNGGGTNSLNNFILIKFPGPTTGSVTFNVTEIIDGCAGDPNSYVVSVSTAPPALTFSTAPTQVCKNDPGTTYTLASSNPTSTYNWTVVGGTILGASSGVGLASIGVAWGNLTTPQPSVRVTETNTGGCSSTPVTINITLNDNPAMTSPGTVPICSGETPAAHLTFTATIPSSFAWRIISVTGPITTGGLPVPVFPAAGSTGTGDITQALKNTSGFIGSVTYEVTPSTLAPPNCQGPAQQVVVTVNPEPVIVPNQMKTVCNNTIVGKEILLTPANLPSGTTFSWPDPDGGGPLSAQSGIPMGTAGTLHINDVINNTSDTYMAVTYQVTASNGSCNGAVEPVIITVEPTPKVGTPVNNAPTICSTQGPDFTFDSPTVPTVAANLTFDVALFTLPSGVVATGVASTGVTGVSATAATPYHFSGGTLTNNNNSSVTVIYRITPKLNGCANGTPVNVSVVVEPLPSVTVTNSTPRLCDGQTPNFAINSLTNPNVPANLTFDIIPTIPAGITATGFANTGVIGITKAVLPYTFTGGTLTNTTDSRITVTYEVFPRLAGCADGPSQVVSIIVEPTPKANTPVNLASVICNGGTPNFSFTTPTVPNTPADLTFDVSINTPLPAGISGTGAAIIGVTGVSASSTTAYVFNSGTLTNSGNIARTVTYTITPKLNGCTDGPVQTVNVVVQPSPIANAPTNSAPIVCNGGTPNFSFTSPTVPNVAGDLTFDVTLNTPLPASVTGTGLAITGALGVSAPYTLNTGTLSNSSDAFQTITYTITPKLNGCANGSTRTVTVRIEPTPRADVPVNSAPVICNGGSPNFSFTTQTSPTTPANLTFDIAPSLPLPSGVTGTGLTVAAATATSTTPYVFNTATLTNTNNTFQTVTFIITPKLNGCADGPTRTVDVKVEPTPSFTFTNSLPFICNAGTPNISVSSLTVPVTPANLTFDVVVALPTGVTGTGVAANGLTGTTAPFFINSGVLNNSSDVAKTVKYTITPKLAGCANGTPQDIFVTVEPTPRATVVNHIPRLCNASSPNIEVNTPTVVSGNSPLTFDVTVTLNGVVGTLAAGNGITGATGPQFFINTGILTNPTNVSKTVTYTITPKLGGCADGPQQVVNVIVEPTPTATVTNIAPRLCNGGTPNVLITTTTTPSNSADLTFDVTVNFSSANLTGTLRAGNGVTGATAAFSINTGVLTNTGNSFETAEYVITPKLNGCPAGTPQSVFVIVEPTPQANAPINHLPVICNNGTPNIEFTSPTTSSVASDLTFDVAVITLPSGVSGSGDAVSGIAGASAPFFLNTGVLTNSNNQVKTVVYRITPKINGCANGPTKTVSVDVEPTPVATFTNSKPSICGGDSPSITITSPTSSSTPSDLKFDISVAAPSGITGTGVAFNGITGVSSGYVLNTGTLVHDNLSNTPLVVVYTITPKLVNANGCTDGTPVQVNVTVRPQPVGVSSTTAAPSQAVCSRQSFTYDIQADNINALGNQVSSKFSFTVTSSDEPNVPTPAALDRLPGVASSAVITSSFTNKTNAEVYITYHITPYDLSTLACPGAPFDVVINIHPEPKGPTVTTMVNICSGIAINYDLQDAIDDTANGGNALANSVFSYSITSVTPSGSDLIPAVFPGTFGRAPGSKSNAPIPDTFRNLTDHDVIITYSVIPYNDPFGCAGDPFTVQVTYYPEPVGVDFTDPVCATTLNFDPQTKITNSIASEFTYTVSSDNGAVPAAPDRTSFSTNPITDVYTNNSGTVANVTYTITARSLAHGCLSTSAPPTFKYVVQIFPTPVAVGNTIPAVCSDGAAIVNPQAFVTNGVTITKYDWKVTYPVQLTGTLPASGTTTSGATGNISFSMNNVTTGALNVTIVITPYNGICPGNNYTVIVPIDAEPVMSTPALPPAVCSNFPINVSLTTLASSIGAASFDVSVVSQDAGLIGTPTVGTALGPNGILNDSFENKTSVPLTVKYRVIPKATNANGCLGDPLIITVTVSPEPVLAIPPPPAVCSTNTNSINPVNIVLSTDGVSVIATTYQVIDIQYSTGGPFSTSVPSSFTVDPSNAPLNTDGTVNLIRNDKYNNKRNGTVTVRYTIQGKSAPASGGCLSTPQNVSIDINPEPILDPALSPTDICSGDKVDPSTTGFQLRATPAVSIPATSFIIRTINLGGATAGSGNRPVGIPINADGLDDDTFTYTGNATFVTVTYTIAPISAAGCIGDDQTVSVRVNPAPAVKPGLDKIVCNNAPSGIVLQDNSPVSIAANRYRINSITYSVASPDFIPNGSNATPITSTTNFSYISNDRFINNTTDRVVVSYDVQPISAANCVGPSVIIKLTVEPEIHSNSSSVVTNVTGICSGDAVSIEFSSPTYANGDPTNPEVKFSYKLVGMSTTAPPAGLTGYTTGNSLNEGEKITDVLVNSTNGVLQARYEITPRAATAANGLGCTGVIEYVVVTIQPRPKITTISNKTVCEADPINLNLASTTVPGSGVIKFLVTAIPENGSVTGFTTSGTYIANNTVLADVLSNSDVEPRYVDYTFEPQNVNAATNAIICANGTPITVRVTVNPRPEVTPSATALEICSSESIEVQLPTDTDQGATLVKWTAVASSVDVIGESGGAGDVLFQTLLNKSNTVQTVTYTITPSFSGCSGPSKILTVTVNPIPTITVPAKMTVCGGDPFVLNLSPLATTAAATTTFKWEVTDINGIGTPGQFDGTGTSINQTIVNSTDASASLLYQITPIFIGTGSVRCEGIPKIINVTIAPAISGAFISTDEGICEGTPIFLTFDLQGQAPFDFVYRATDANGVVTDIPVTKSGNVKVIKVTPLVTTSYEIVSMKDALGCTKTLTPMPKVTITVYKKVTANWVANIPPFVGGSSTVSFTNTSTPVDGSIFDYNWTFTTDNEATPGSATGEGPYAVVYSRPGDHYVSMQAVNKAAPADLGCESTYAAKITIPLLPLIAAFKAEPNAACFPQNIVITENTSTGDRMNWKVIDSNGRVAASSNLALPEFLITSPGKYTITLETSNSFTNQNAFAPSQDVTIYENPVASFDLRPVLVYIPDTELTTFNFSTGAPEYVWDFGDGGTSTEKEPKYTYTVEGKYDVTLIAMNDHGDGAVCTDTLKRQVVAKQGGVTKVPNAFTPSPNGPNGGIAGNNTFNDVFLPLVKGAEEFNMQIFDRWGNLIFESNDSSRGWDGYDKHGKLLPAGVYVYKLTLRLSDGQRSTQIGDITMIR